MLHHCRGGNLTSQFVEHANCPLFSVQMKIHRSNNGIFAVPPQKQHSEGKSQGKLFDIVNFFFLPFPDRYESDELDLQVGKLERQEMNGIVVNNPRGGRNPGPDLSVLIHFLFHFSMKSM